MSERRRRPTAPSDLSVGELARRDGAHVSTLHCYEAEGLIEIWRNPANHRRYDRWEMRRVAVIRVAQTLGISLAEIRDTLTRVPRDGGQSRLARGLETLAGSDHRPHRIAAKTAKPVGSLHGMRLPFAGELPAV